MTLCDHASVSGRVGSAEGPGRHAPRPPLGRKRQVHRGEHHITVRAVARPEIDIKKLSRAIVMPAMEMARDEAEAKEQADHDQAA